MTSDKIEARATLLEIGDLNVRFRAERGEAWDLRNVDLTLGRGLRGGMQWCGQMGAARLLPKVAVLLPGTPNKGRPGARFILGLTSG